MQYCSEAIDWTRANMHAYSSRKNPASLKHFTLVFSGKYLVKLSQCRKDAKPPAEQPESKAYREGERELII